MDMKLVNGESLTKMGMKSIIPIVYKELVLFVMMVQQVRQLAEAHVLGMVELRSGSKRLLNLKLGEQENMFQLNNGYKN
jgi:hypothetical protein